MTTTAAFGRPARGNSVALAGLLLGLVLALAPGAARAATPVVCNGGGQLKVQGLMPGGVQPDLLVNGPCNVDMAQNGANPTVFYYGRVNIVGGGSLNFNQPKTDNPDIDFWASSIIVEANGALTAGIPDNPYGQPRLLTKDGGFLTIHLYGKNDSVDDTGKPVDPVTKPGQGVLCQSPLTKDTDGNPVPCGIPPKVWQNNGSTVLVGCGNNPITKDSECIPGLADATKDFFYQYGPLYGDDKCSNSTKTKTIAFSVEGGKALCGSDPAAGKVGYFGYKVLAVSYGGTLVLRGYKGAADGIDSNHLATGNSWLRLDGDVSSGTSLTVDGDPAGRWWLPSDGARDQIVVTTTDYLPGHSELLTLNMGNGMQGNQANFAETIQWFHSGKRYLINLGAAKGRLEASGMDKNLVKDGAETRAAVALLTRSIRIVSEGDVAGETYAEALKKNSTYSFGGHTLFRQGFKQGMIQGVEFVNLGQGGKLGHYPVHFHMARQVPAGTIVKDSSVNESNTRWYVAHDTQGVTFQRNVGWKSIGHGFYLENGTEANNNYYANIGIFARAAIANAQNPRRIPGILADNQDPTSAKFQKPNIPNPGFPYRSDNEYPTVFWISNGWNNFQGNMAAGAGACGAAYWFVPMENSDTPDVPTDKNQYVDPDPTTKTNHMKWADGGVEDDGTVHFGYAGLQRLPLWAGSTPLESFYKNYATSTMMSFQTTADAPACDGFVAADEAKNNPPSVPFVAEVASFAPEPKRGPRPPPDTGEGPDLKNDKFYPHAIESRKGTRCAVSDFAGLPDCSKPKEGVAGLKTPCTDGTAFLAAGFDPDTPNNPMFPCAPTVIDHFTSSFHWAQGDVSAIWLRPQWYLVTNSVLTDVQQGGVTFVTGGDVLRASIITGYWGLLRDSLLIGHTQPQDADHKFARDIGPFNSFTTEKCEKATGSKLPSYCLNKAEGVSLPLTGFFNNQRMENIYDGPSYRDSTAYLDVETAGCPVGDFNKAIDTCIYGTKQTAGVLNKNPGGTSDCYVPNAAIAWKQPNGFFYPPAFHAENLYFGNVDIRHFVIDPLFKPFKDSTPATGDFGQAGSYLTDGDAVSRVYCVPSGVNEKNYFNDFTSIDRQTELNDDDGALTGLSNDIQKALDPPNPLKQTISVNEDDYFTAPVETSECASNIGKNNEPGNACKSPSKAAPTVTAKTSPYDYVSTVIFHTTFGDKWDADCTNPKCYGVPLYRQFLAGDQGDVKDPTHKNATREWKHWYQNKCDEDQTTLKCRWPFIRMAGTAKNTRETLTVNNGTYYLDTTVPFTIQKTEPYNTQNGGASLTSSVNVFQPDEQVNPKTKFIGTYNVFFVYAKPTTRQTYQIYLGKDATAADIKAIRVKLIDLTLDTDFATKQPWLEVNTDQVKDKGIVSVTVDFSKLTGEDKDSLKTIPKNGLCQPLTFCKPSGDTCGSAVSPDDPLVKANKDFKTQTAGVCKEWAVKDLDAPPKGAYGFSFTIPKTGFTADATLKNPSPHRPAPEPFPTDNKNQGQPTWRVKFLGTTTPPDATNGECHYATLPTYPPPGTGECTVPDWVPQ